MVRIDERPAPAHPAPELLDADGADALAEVPERR